MEFKTNQDIYNFAKELSSSFMENGHIQISKAIINSFAKGSTASEQLGELRIVFEKIINGWGNPSPDLKNLIQQAIDRINMAFKRKE